MVYQRGIKAVFCGRNTALVPFCYMVGGLEVARIVPRRIWGLALRHGPCSHGAHFHLKTVYL